MHGAQDYGAAIMSAVESPRLLLRDMLIHDLTQILEVERRVYEFPWREKIFQDCFKENYICKVFEFGAELLGYGIASVAAGECHILNLCIHPDVQNRGLGNGMLQSLIRECRLRGIEMIFLEVRVSNKNAQSLYLKVGFNQIGLRSGYYPALKGREDAFVFAMDIS